jgi:hypothetical protein
MCDASTHFLSNDTDPEVVSAMVTRDLGDRGDEPLEQFLKRFLPPRRDPPPR